MDISNYFKEREQLISKHPCFNNNFKASGRMHLPVAYPCNIKCCFCKPTVDSCYHGCRPGVSSNVLSVQEAVRKVDMAVNIDPNFLVVGIAGPGEPLLSKETIETFKVIHEKYPKLLLCVSTNGLLLEEKVDDLKGLVDTLTVTVNALTVETAMKIYEHIASKRTYEAYDAFLKGQWIGIKKAIEAGLKVKINTVYVKGRNDNEIEAIAVKAKEYGCLIHNILPVIPNENILAQEVPNIGEVERMRYLCSRHLEELTTCSRCRADVLVLSDGSTRTCSCL